jgi:fumarate hydratase class II
VPPGRSAGSVAEAENDGMTEPEGYRIERDTMGEIPVPADALYGAQTQRAVQNFPFSGVGVEPAVLAALARIKAAAARTNAELGLLAGNVGEAIAEAADLVAADLVAAELVATDKVATDKVATDKVATDKVAPDPGTMARQFPVDVFQTGSGTSSNMNLNEVLATLAGRRLGRPVHPNDEVNASQSSNDTFPSAVHLAAADAVAHRLVPALAHLATAFEAQADRCADVVKAGRTHLMDATPVTLGQEFGGYAAQLRRGVERLQGALPRLLELPLGGTAVGTGLNAPAGFTDGVLERLREATGLAVHEARNHFEAQGARDGLVELSGALRTVAVSLTKICNDLRWMGSGPTAGLAEIRLPDLQPGSSIMPGKVNPVLPEAVLQICAQVIGHDATVAWAGAAGSFELNVMMPVMSRAVLESVRLLAAGCRQLADRCVAGIEPDRERALALAESSPSVVTALNRVIGYENAARIAKHAVAQRTTIRDAAIALGFVERGELSEADLDRLLDVRAMARPVQGSSGVHG